MNPWDDPYVIKPSCTDRGIPICPRCGDEMVILFTTSYYCPKCAQNELTEERSRINANKPPETLEGCLKGRGRGSL